VGIVGVEFLVIPTLAGSAAYAFAETLGSRQGLDKKLKHARAFCALIFLSTAVGVGLDFGGTTSVKALYWTTVIHGLLIPSRSNPGHCFRRQADAWPTKLLG
jgi:hypothetical protein